MAPFVAHSSFWRMLLIISGSVAMVIFGLWIAGFFDSSPGPGNEWFGWFCIILFGCFAAEFSFRIFDTSDQVKISEEGVYYKPWSDQIIPWLEISNFSVRQYRSQKTIVLYLPTYVKGPSSRPSNTIFGRIPFANRACQSGYVVTLNLQGTTGEFDDAFAAVSWFYKKHGTQQFGADYSN
jgi:hypothetical protein